MNRQLRVTSGLAADYLGFIVYTVIGIAMTPLMLHYLGQEAYGLLLVFGSLLGYLALPANAISSSTAKHVAHYRATGEERRLSEFVSSALAACLPLAAIILAASLALTPFVGGIFNLSPSLAAIARWVLPVSGTTLALTLVLSALSGILIGHQRMDAHHLLTAAFYIVNSVLTAIALVLLGSGLLGVAMVGLLAVIAQLVAAAALVRKLFPGVHVSPRLLRSWALRLALPFSAFLLLHGVGAQIIFRTDSIVIGAALGTREVALYAIAFQIVMTAVALTFKVSDALLASFAELHALGQREAMRRVHLESQKVSLALGVCASVGLVFFAKPLTALWVGADNFVGTPTMLALALLPLMQSATHAGIVTLIGIGRVRGVATLNIIEAALNLALSVALVQPLGVLGVALGTVIAKAATNLWFIPWQCNRELGLATSDYVRAVTGRSLLTAPPAIATAWLTTTLLPPSHPSIVLLVGVPTTALAFFGAYLLLTSADERQAYRSMLQGMLAHLRRERREVALS